MSTPQKKVKAESQENRKVLIILSILHSVLLIFLTLWLLDQNVTYGDEKALIKWSTIIKKLVFKIDPKPAQQELLFINTAYDISLIDKLDENEFPVGFQTITDRTKLAKLFEVINTGNFKPKYIICDIFFKDKSPDDSLLNSQISKIDNIVIPYHLKENNQPNTPIFNVNKGLADYNIIEDSFLKYSLLTKDSLESLPLVMYNNLYKSNFKKKNILYFLNNHLSFNTIVIDFRVRYYDIQEGKSATPYPYVNLGEFLSLPDSIISQTIKDKIIVMGDLQDRDIHKTILGTMPGSMILLNVYLTLVNKENIINIFLLLILFLAYFFVSYDLFSKKNIKERKSVKVIMQYKFGKFFVNYLGYLLYLGILSTFLYILYNIQINIFILAVYLKIIELFINHFRTEKDKRDKKSFFKNIYKFRKEFIKVIKSQN